MATVHRGAAPHTLGLIFAVTIFTLQSQPLQAKYLFGSGKNSGSEPKWPQRNNYPEHHPQNVPNIPDGVVCHNCPPPHSYGYPYPYPQPYPYPYSHPYPYPYYSGRPYDGSDAPFSEVHAGSPARGESVSNSHARTPGGIFSLSHSRSSNANVGLGPLQGSLSTGLSGGLSLGR